MLEAYSQQIGNALYHIRNMDIPGIDVIWRQIFPGKSTLFPRIASSAAHQIGREYAMSESYAVYGDGLTYEQMRFIAASQFARGINIINLMSITSGREGFLWAQSRPHFVSELLQMDYLEDFNRYLYNMMYLCSIGKSCNNIALYIPMRDAWVGEEDSLNSYYEIGRKMEENQVSFDIADDEYICGSEICNSRLGTAGYKIIVLPETKYIKKETLKKLSEFESSGGCVLHCEIPKGNIECGCKNIRVLKRESERESIYILFNESTEKEYFKASFNEKYQNAYRISAAEGEIYEFDLNNPIVLQSGEECVVLFTNDTYDFKRVYKKGELISAIDDFEMVLEEQNILKEAKPLRISVNEKINKWDKSISGKVRYKTKFSAEKGKALIIDLGDVKYFAEVYLNGEKIGRKIMPPSIILL